jgi:AAA family ATP:ADP antiporter
MAVAGCMLAHHVAAKAVRDAAFLTAWPATALPAIVIVTAILVVAAVPVFAQLLARFSPRVVVPAGFAVSAALHLIEWRSPSGPWMAVAIYLHIAGFGALLLSGFWSLVSELVNPATAKHHYGRVAAAGTLGGLAGGLAAERIAATLAPEAALLFLAAVHGLCAAGAFALGAAGIKADASAAHATPSGPLFEFHALRSAPHLRALALLVVTGTAAAAILDFLLKERAAEVYTTGSDLLYFFAVFYTAVQVLTFAAQAGVGTAVQRMGLGQTISTLPAGLGAGGIAAILFPIFPLLVVVRAVESVLRGSFFRAGYELLFVPMDPAEKRRTKTFLDVTCDRAGDALGAGIVQVLLILAPIFLVSELLAVVVALAAAGLWLGRRLDVMYVRVVERRLVGQLSVTPAVLGSETAWTIIELPALQSDDASTSVVIDQSREMTRAASGAPVPPRPRVLDPRLEQLAELRSGDRVRVERALAELDEPDALIAAQVIELLAWDDVVGRARGVLEQAARVGKRAGGPGDCSGRRVGGRGGAGCRSRRPTAGTRSGHRTPARPDRTRRRGRARTWRAARRRSAAP